MSEHHLHALPKGSRIEEYEIVRVLGAGGFGITYLAFDHNLDGPVAIKEYFYSGLAVRVSGGAVKPSSTGALEGFEWGRARFLDEGRLLARLDHPNVVRVHRRIEANNTAYIVMDYVEGESLAAVVARHGTLAPAQWRPWMEALLDGLEHVHGRAYLHRDIKPENIVIRADGGGPVMVDFGSARRAAVEKTRQLTAVHTPGYAPIEQYSESGRQGPATDIYGLAAVSYRALTGEPPLAAADRVFDDHCIPLAERVSGAERAWLETLDQGLALRPEDRPPTVAAWRAALTDALDVHGPTVDALPGDNEEAVPHSADYAATQAGEVVRGREGATSDWRSTISMLLLPVAIVAAFGLLGRQCGQTSTPTTEYPRAERSIPTEWSDNPPATTAAPTPSTPTPGTAPRSGPAAAQGPTPGGPATDTAVVAQGDADPPAPPESPSSPAADPAPRPAPAEVQGSAPGGPAADTAVVRQSDTDPPGSPVSPNSPAAASTPSAQVGETTVVGWSNREPVAPVSGAKVGDTTVVGWTEREPVRAPGDAQRPTKVRDVRPIYPRAAQAARVEGIVILEVVIGPSGQVTDIKVLRSAPLLDEAAIEAVRQWEYTPTLLNGVPVPVVMTVTVNFTL